MHGLHLSKDGSILDLAISSSDGTFNALVFFVWNSKNSSYVFSCSYSLGKLGQFGYFGVPSERKSTNAAGWGAGGGV